MHKPKIECIYLDMDGVIADFVKRYEELFGMSPNKAEKDKRFNKLFDMFIQDNNFATLDLMSGAMEGIEFLRKSNVPTQMLTSTANERRHEEIMKQKSIWLQSHGITFNPIFVPGKHLKQNYATPQRILIDDTSSNITDWKKAGGIGILHLDWATTLTILRMYV
jgi:hypothetical protein